MTWRVGDLFDQDPATVPAGPWSAGDSRAERERVAEAEFEDELAAASVPAEIDRWLDISRDWTERLRAMGMERGRSSRWPVAELRTRILAAVKAGRDPNDFQPMKDVTNDEQRLVGPGHAKEERSR